VDVNKKQEGNTVKETDRKKRDNRSKILLREGLRGKTEKGVSSSMGSSRRERRVGKRTSGGRIGRLGGIR